MAAPEHLTQETALETIFSFQQRLASLAGNAEAFAATLLPADDGGGGGRAAVLEASRLARQAMVAFASATATVVAGIGGTGGEGTGAGGGGGGATAAAATALRAPNARQDQFQGGECGGDRDEPPANKRARVAAGTGARAAATAAAAAAAAAATAAAGGGGQDDGFVFASQNVTKFLLSKKKIVFNMSVVRALRLDGDAPDAVKRGAALSMKESYRFSVFALRSAPARRGSSSWEPPARDAPGTQAFDSDVVSYTCDDGRGSQYNLARAGRCFRRRGERIMGGSTQEGALRDAKVGDELVFARRGTDRELFIWLVKREQGGSEGDRRGDDNEEPLARKRARVEAGTGARAAAAAPVATAATAATAAQPPPDEAEPRAADLFSSLFSSSSETFPAPSSSTSSEEDDGEGGRGGGGGGAGEGAEAAAGAAAGGGGGAGGGGQDDGFVFASQLVTKIMLSRRTIDFRSHVVRALRLNGGAPDAVQRGTKGADSRKESYRFSVFVLRSAPARRGSSSWEPPATGAPGTQAFDSDFTSYTSHTEKRGTQFNYGLASASRCFQRRGDKGVATAEQEGALRGAEVGDELVFARRGTDRELLIWLVKNTQD